MRTVYITFMYLFFSFYANAETFYCEYQSRDKIKNIKFDRTGHSHFKKCQDNVCENTNLSIIHVDNKNLIFGDIFLNEKSIQYFRIYFIDKKNNFFKELKISMPGSNLENEVIEGNCQNKNQNNLL